MDRSFSRYTRYLAFAAALLLTACGGPADEKLVTANGLDAYKSSLAPIVAKLSPEQRTALDWAVSDLNLDTLHARYPGGSVRDIVRGEARLVLDTYPAAIAELEKRDRVEAPLRKQLARISATDVRFAVERNFFGPQPTIRASITNASGLPVSSLDWRAALYIDDRKEPEATTVLTSDFRENGGLRPGSRFSSRFNVGFVRGDEAWSTLAIRNARSTRVVMEPVLESIRDFSNKPYVASDTRAEIDRRRAALKEAERYEAF